MFFRMFLESRKLGKLHLVILVIFASRVIILSHKCYIHSFILYHIGVRHLLCMEQTTKLVSALYVTLVFVFFKLKSKHRCPNFELFLHYSSTFPSW